MIRELTNLMKFIKNETQVFEYYSNNRILFEYLSFVFYKFQIISDYSNNIRLFEYYYLFRYERVTKPDDKTIAEEFWNLNSNRFPGSFEIFKTFKERLLLEHHQNEFFHVQSRNQVWNRRNQMATH